MRGRRRQRRAAAGRGGVPIVVAALALALAACVAPDPPASGVDPETGFPFGAYGKEIADPSLGRMRVDWVFGPDGRWAEVPIPLDGQRQPSPVVRGTWEVQGDELVVATTWPEGWGTSRHRWRADGDDLWTVFLSSDVPEDADWFSMLDTRPWRPLP